MALWVARTNFGSNFYPFNMRVCICRTLPAPTCSGFAQRSIYTGATATSRVKHTVKPSRSSQPLVSPRKAPAPPLAAQQRASSPTGSTPASKNEDAKAEAKRKHLEMSEEEREKELQKFLQMSEAMPTVDLFAQDQTTLDVMIPYPYDKSLPISTRFQHMRSNVSNYFKNAAALQILYKSNCLPGLVFPEVVPLMSRIRYGFKSLGTQSVKRSSFLGPFRRFALDIYEELNTAIANRSDRDVRKITTSDYQNHAINLIKKSLKRIPNGRMIWQLHRVVEPVQVVSLRVTQGHFDEQEPKYGSRWLAHALVKFHTEQSLEVYDRHARPLHIPAVDDQEKKFVVVNDADKKPEKWRVPAKKRHVKEYLVLEKRMWQQGPWMVREQMWPTWAVKDSQNSAAESSTDASPPPP